MSKVAACPRGLAGPLQLTVRVLAVVARRDRREAAQPGQFGSLFTADRGRPVAAPAAQRLDPVPQRLLARLATRYAKRAAYLRAEILIASIVFWLRTDFPDTT